MGVGFYFKRPFQQLRKQGIRHNFFNCSEIPNLVLRVNALIAACDTITVRKITLLTLRKVSYLHMGHFRIFLTSQCYNNYE